MRRYEGWFWGALLVGSLFAAAVGAMDWIGRGGTEPVPEGIALEEIPPPGYVEPPPLPEGFVPDLPPVPTLPPGTRAPEGARGDHGGEEDDARLAQLGAEMRLLQEARAQVERSPATALTLLEQHRERFASGVLSEEREVYAIEALMRLEQTAQAERRYLDFREAFPDSTFTSRLEQLMQ